MRAVALSLSLSLSQSSLSASSSGEKRTNSLPSIGGIAKAKSYQEVESHDDEGKNPLKGDHVDRKLVYGES